ncbi:protein FAM47E-like [Arvicanthis niloticus]|uniref:protein FAM47E-like n=1 Tax=Arvicanthis niloticus TaxID=61156 RepID=UPI001487480D|nr:protein FAM47A-like [Arvicanthis niloticus]
MGEQWLPWNRPRQVLQPMPLGMTCKPWFKDRLPSKCFAKHKQEQLKFPTSLDGRRWVFVKEGLDDFRKGCPPSEGMIIRGPKESFLPTISHEVQRGTRKSQQKRCQDLSLFSSLSLAQQARKAFVERTEANLIQHQLAFWPMEDGTPSDSSSDLSENVVEASDTDQNLEETLDHSEDHRKSVHSVHLPSVSEECSEKKEEPEPPRFPGSRKHGLLGEKKKPRKKDPAKESLYYRYIPKGVYDFCAWVDSFGDLEIDEHFMMKQFDIGYECKPVYTDSAIKKISLLPGDIKRCRRLSKVKEIRFSIQEANFERKLRKPHDPYKPTRDKIRYGAWYLKPYLWKKLVNDEPLMDPEELFELEGGRFGKPDIIEDLYGTIAFKDFIISKGYSMPTILEKLFMRKGWNYDTVNTPIPRVLKAHELIMQQKDEDYDDEND